MQNFNKALILVDFQLNRDFISKNICIKKDQADNCCKGSCQLKNKLKEADKKEQNTPASNQKQVKEFQLYFQQFSPDNIASTFSVAEAFRPFQFPEINSPSFSVFHPPQC